MVVRFIYGDDFWDSFDKANISLEELNSFRNFKSINPLAKFGKETKKKRRGLKGPKKNPRIKLTEDHKEKLRGVRGPQKNPRLHLTEEHKKKLR